jgi:hypothetical protein
LHPHVLKVAEAAAGGPSYPGRPPNQRIGRSGNRTGAGALSHSVNQQKVDITMGGIIYLVGLIVVIMAVLSFFGLR